MNLKTINQKQMGKGDKKKAKKCDSRGYTNICFLLK